MTNLLMAGLYRVKKNKIFYIFSIIVVLFAFYILHNTSSLSQAPMLEDLIETSNIFFYSLLLGLFDSIFISAFLGDDYNSGAIKNKIICGKDRNKIYISNFLLMNIVTLFFLGLLVIILLGVGVVYFGRPTVSLGEILYSVFIFALVSVAFNSIIVYIGMMMSSATKSIIVSVLLSIALIFGAIFAMNALLEPETITSYTMQNGENVSVLEPNPAYPVGIKREIIELFIDINPIGEALKVSDSVVNGDQNDHSESVFYMLGVIIVFNGVGLLLFNRKELY